jgi:hypothetical protein
VKITPYSLTSALDGHVAQLIAAQGGWIGFDAFMALALYTPGLGYYANDSVKFGAMPYAVQAGMPVPGSDFVTAPEMTPLFGQTLAAQVAQALQVTRSGEVWEFGAGSGRWRCSCWKRWVNRSNAAPSAVSRAPCARGSSRRGRNLAARCVG